jgi:hypothetical protein
MGQQVSQQQQQQEQQQQELNFHITTGTEGSAALAAAERQDHYLEDIANNKVNRIARQSMTYATNRLTISQQEILRAKLQELVPSVPYILRSLYPTIVPLMSTADDGMPHTRPDTLICLPQSGGFIDKTTFVHELWHLHQRAHYKEWVLFFANSWNWQPFVGDLPPDLEQQRRLNPDTLADPLWIWDSTWVPVCLFLNPTNPSFDDTATWFFNVKTGRHNRELPEAMAAFFSSSLSPSAYEHPCETSAYMITGPPLSCPAYKALLKQWNNTPYK